MRQALDPLAVMVIGWLMVACSSAHPWEGQYVGQPGQGAHGAVTLVLQAGGKGLWTADQESTPLRWEERDGGLWLHLNTGGVVICRPVRGHQELTIALPGIQPFTLRKERS